MKLMTAPPLACTVRHCGLVIERQGDAWLCARRHAYDVARSGYINLLQPQDRKSLNAGDSKDAVTARSRLLADGIGGHVVDAFVDRALGVGLAFDSVVADLGAGAGEVLGSLAARQPVIGIGIDLSTAAVELASRQYPELTWVIANADRRLPLLDGSVDLVLSLHGRRNPDETARVLTRDGRLLVGVPAPDDLIELRQSVQGRAVEHERSDRLLAEHASDFSLLDRFSVRRKQQVDRTALMDVLRGTYRGARRSAIGRVEALTTLEVTLATDIFLCGLVRQSNRAR